MEQEFDFIYGINPAFEVIRAGKRKIFGAYVSKGDNPKIKKIIQNLTKANVEITYAENGRLIDLSGTPKHQGIVLKTSQYPYCNFESLLEENKLLLLDNMEDPQNLGAILRSAEVLGFTSILLSNKGTANIYPSVVKASSGATEYLKISKEMTANTYVNKAIENGYIILAFDENGKMDIEDIRQIKIDKVLLIIGGEDKSVGQYILNSAHYVVKIKQHGRINSLNASVAAGIAMYTLANR